MLQRSVPTRSGCFGWSASYASVWARKTNRMTGDATAHEARLRRSLRRLGYELVDAERGHFHIRREGSKDNETPDLFGLDLAGVEQWIRDNAPKKRA